MKLTEERARELIRLWRSNAKQLREHGGKWATTDNYLGQPNKHKVMECIATADAWELCASHLENQL